MFLLHVIIMIWICDSCSSFEHFVCNYMQEKTEGKTSTITLSFLQLFNPFTPELPITAWWYPHPFYPLWYHQFNGQGQLCLLNCTEWRDLSNHTRMNKIQSRTWEKKAKKPCNIYLKNSLKILFHYLQKAFL